MRTRPAELFQRARQRQTGRHRRQHQQRRQPVTLLEQPVGRARGERLGDRSGVSHPAHRLPLTVRGGALTQVRVKLLDHPPTAASVHPQVAVELPQPVLDHCAITACIAPANAAQSRRLVASEPRPACVTA